jgi:hypothetical protein
MTRAPLLLIDGAEFMCFARSIQLTSAAHVACFQNNMKLTVVVCPSRMDHVVHVLPPHLHSVQFCLLGAICFDVVHWLLPTLTLNGDSPCCWRHIRSYNLRHSSRG